MSGVPGVTSAIFPHLTLTYSQSTIGIIQLFLHEKSPQNPLSPFEQVNSYSAINDLLVQDLIN